MPTPTGSETGVLFPTTPDGSRSTTSLGRAVIADAVRRSAPEVAAAAESEKDWRQGYLAHLRRTVEAGVPTAGDALAIATDGLASLHERFVFARDGGQSDLAAALDATPAAPLRTAVVKGEASRPAEGLSIPYGGERLTGAALDRQLDS